MRVVEKGFSVTKRIDGPMLSYGIVLENTSRFVAKLDVRIRMLDASGKAVKAMLVQPTAQLTHTVDNIFPGERYGVGYIVSTAGPDERARNVVKLEVKLVEVEWWPSKSTPMEYAVPRPFIRVKLDKMKVEPDKRSGGAAIRFTVVSSHKDAINDPYVRMVFRDKAGKVLGGADSTLNTVFPPGKSAAEVEIPHGVPDGIDESRSDVFFG
ncbi:MAG: hypothetical protein ACRDTU_11305 [Micromonosporaceae bacterium]